MEKYCSVNTCSKKLEKHSQYRSCQNCYKNIICCAEDASHNNALLQNEGCKEHTSCDYEVCIMCALECFQIANFRNYNAGEEHCWCPICNHDFGALKDLPNTETIVEKLNVVQIETSCSIEGCVSVQNHKGNFHYMSYGWCGVCTELNICYRGANNEREHSAALLYHTCSNCDSDSVCQACAKKAYMEKYPESTEQTDGRLCPICNHNFSY